MLVSESTAAPETVVSVVSEEGESVVGEVEVCVELAVVYGRARSGCSASKRCRRVKKKEVGQEPEGIFCVPRDCLSIAPQPQATDADTSLF